jgi:hypothetical protein
MSRKRERLSLYVGAADRPSPSEAATAAIRFGHEAVGLTGHPSQCTWPFCATWLQSTRASPRDAGHVDGSYV